MAEQRPMGLAPLDEMIGELRNAVEDVDSTGSGGWAFCRCDSCDRVIDDDSPTDELDTGYCRECRSANCHGGGFEGQPELGLL
jgi:hypothetical protein